MLAALQWTLAGAPLPSGDEAVAERRQQMERGRSELRLALRAAGEQAALLDSMDGDEQQYESVVGQQISRLRSLDLLGDVDSGGSARSAPVELTVMRASMSCAAPPRDLGAQLASVKAIRPRRRQVAGELHSRSTVCASNFELRMLRSRALTQPRPGASAWGRVQSSRHSREAASSTSSRQRPRPRRPSLPGFSSASRSSRRQWRASKRASIRTTNASN